MNSRVVAIFTVVSVLMVASVTALLTFQWTVPGTGSITGVGLGVYWDQDCTNATTLLPFGRLDPGSSKSFTLYLRNEGNTVTTLNMTSANWNPVTAPNYLTLTWNRENFQVNPNQVISCVITLSVAQNTPAMNSFSVDIEITGTG